MGLEWTFNTQAKLYEKTRPGYPEELYSKIFEYININQESNVLEIGIGGGQATLPILKTGCKLTAVEYGENLAEVCRQKFKDYPNFSVITGKFEDFAGEENSYDLIYSASAFHWIPEEIGYPKVFSLLKKGGVFARFANHPYKDKEHPDLYNAIQEQYAKYMPGSKPSPEYTADDAEKIAEIAVKYGFSDISHELYRRTRTFTAKEYTALLGTYSDHIALEEKIRTEFFAEIERTIDDFGGEITVYDTIDLELARR